MGLFLLRPNLCTIPSPSFSVSRLGLTPVSSDPGGTVSERITLRFLLPVFSGPPPPLGVHFPFLVTPSNRTATAFVTALCFSAATGLSPL